MMPSTGHPQASTAFEQLREAMIKTHILALLDFVKPFIIESNACHIGMGPVLMQEGRPLA